MDVLSHQSPITRLGKTVIAEATENNVAFIEQCLRRLETMGDRPKDNSKALNHQA